MPNMSLLADLAQMLDASFPLTTIIAHARENASSDSEALQAIIEATEALEADGDVRVRIGGAL